MKFKKLFLCLTLVVILTNTFCFITNEVNASGLDTMIEDAKGFSKDDEVKTIVVVPITVDKLEGVSDIITNILLVVAVAVAIISIIAVGINFMVQSTEGKAKVKESLIPLVVGMFVSFGAFGIWKICVSLFSKI